MRISNLQKKMLVVLLRYDRKLICNLFFDPQERAVKFSEDLPFQNQDSGLSPLEVGIWTTRRFDTEAWRLKRSLESLRRQELVDIVEDGSSDIIRYHLTDKGREIALEVDKEMWNSMVESARVYGISIQHTFNAEKWQEHDVFKERGEDGSMDDISVERMWPDVVIR